MTRKRSGKGASPVRGPAKPKTDRLAPGELDKLVLAYMRKHKKELPLGAGKIAKGIERSSGAVANCLVRLTEKKKVRLAQQKPRLYSMGR